MEVPPVWTAARVQEDFINYFESKSQSQSHTPWPSSLEVPVYDPAILFANAGMNQFKPVLILGTASPDSQLGRLRRACNTQKRIRAEAQRPRRHGEGGGRRRVMDR
ncbi:hypothetical protein CFC21_066779 [Triticum aestivum]|uniref:Alanyl-tRNA synthetase class IIc N-terminal domain-containing protein n=3 Tax=Triticum TaxID=4564 RepID=A0A9R0WQ42_TRITD|nr:alanine--tRNA ligase-like [Triticum dicoccoides]KAF7059942.1 hypothetical protein CFC21_066779 [Triticum aestivum]VAI19891.1 unnamed protein product [Triticum turgidum subsp. durum]